MAPDAPEPLVATVRRAESSSWLCDNPSLTGSDCTDESDATPNERAATGEERSTASAAPRCSMETFGRLCASLSASIQRSSYNTVSNPRGSFTIMNGRAGVIDPGSQRSAKSVRLEKRRSQRCGCTTPRDPIPTVPSAAPRPLRPTSGSTATRSARTSAARAELSRAERSASIATSEATQCKANTANRRREPRRPRYTRSLPPTDAGGIVGGSPQPRSLRATTSDSKRRQQRAEEQSAHL